jgi:phage gp36-like protein
MTIRWEDKDPGDRILVEFDFAKDAASVSSPDVIITVQTGEDASPAAMLDGAPQVVGAKVLQWLIGGKDGVDYALQCTANGTGGAVLTIEAVLPVRARAIAPDGSPRYITEAQFEQRFTARELTELLEDGAAFVRAENDAASLIDGYLASRYSLPLLAVPDIVRGWAGDITRFKLWDDHAPEEVRRRYEDAITQLKDLAAGRLALPPDAAGVAVAASGFYSEGYSDTRVFTATTLAGF